MPKRFFNMRKKIGKPKSKGKTLGFYNKGPNSYYGTERNSNPKKKIVINPRIDLKTKYATANGRIKPNPTRIRKKPKYPNISNGKQLKDIVEMAKVVESMLSMNTGINPIKPLRKFKK